MNKGVTSLESFLSHLKHGNEPFAALVHYVSHPGVEFAQGMENEAEASTKLVNWVYVEHLSSLGLERYFQHFFSDFYPYFQYCN